MAVMDIGMVTSLVFTFGVLSLALYKDNHFYRICESVFIGSSLGNIFIMAYKSIINDSVMPLLAGDIVYLIPIFLGLLFYARFSKTWKFLPRWPTAIMAAIGVAIVARGWIDSYVILGTRYIISQFFNPPNILVLINAFIVLIISISFLVYHIFTFNVQKGSVSYLHRLGRYAQIFAYSLIFAGLVIGGFSLISSRIDFILGVFGFK